MNQIIKTLIYSLLLFFISLPLYSQKPRTSTSSKKAEKLYLEALEAKSRRDFGRAMSNLEKAIKIDEGFVEARMQLGGMYLIYREDQKAINQFKKCVELRPDDKNLAGVYVPIADYELEKGNYQAALDYTDKLVSLQPSARFSKQVAEAKHIQKNAEFAIEGIKNPVDFNPKPLDKEVNRFAQQYFPVLTADQSSIFYTARLASSDENMYVSTFQDSVWTEPVYIKELNTHYNEGTCSISADGKQIIFTACDDARIQRRGSRTGYGSCDLFISKKTGDTWSLPQNLGRNVNSSRWESQPALSADGRTLFFVSDRNGGQGGKDIWMSKLTPTGEWGIPQNLGKTINTSGDDISPFIHVNGESFFFASNGHSGFGGLDLFQSTLTSEGWTTPKNIGYPINNHNDQASLFITSDGKQGYYSNEVMQNGRMISSELHVFDLPKEIVIENTSDYVKGIVYDAKTKKPLKAQIDLVDLSSEKVVSTVTSDSENGEFLMVLTKGAEYAFYVDAPDYLFKSLSFDFISSPKVDSVKIDIPMDAIVIGSKISLNNIFFETGSFELLDKSKTELNKIVKFMRKNTQVKIEIGGHTDDVGSEKSNTDLSLNRAKAVVEFLHKNGVAKERLSYEGYGESQPIVANDSEANRAKNRRIEFKISE